MKKNLTIKKIKLQLLSFVLLLIATVSNAQLVERWSSVIPSADPAGNVHHAILITSDENIVAAGTSKIIKYSPNGNIIWETDVVLPASLTSQGFSMASDKAGNIYVTAARALNAGILGGETDFFVAKYNSDGQQLWSRLFDGPGKFDDESVGISIDQFSNVYIAGNTFVGGGLTEEIYTAKFNTDGIIQWQVTYPNESRANDIVVDFFTGNVYVTGGSFVAKDGDVPHLEDFTTIKYNTNGVQQWVNLYNGSLHADDKASAIAIDADGNVIATGFSTETIVSDFFAGTTTYATIKYDRNTGDQIWNKRFGRNQSEGSDEGFFETTAKAITVDGDDNVIVTGEHSQNNQWGTIKYRKSDGKALWVKSFDNTQFDNDGSKVGLDVPFSVAVDGANNVFVTGVSLANQTFEDIFTIKYRASNGDELGKARFDNGDNESGAGIVVNAKGNAFVTGGSGSSAFITVSYGICAIICPQNITTNNEPGKCGAILKFDAKTTGDSGPLVFLEGQDTVKSGLFFSVGVHTILVKSPSTEETCSFTITIVDIENPVITQSPASLTVSCAADVPLPDIRLVTATDNCGDVTISHAGDVISNQTCTNRFTVTRTYKATDNHGNTATCSQVITVNDDTPPRITGFSLSRESLFPQP